jgi:hypothetical protein
MQRRCSRRLDEPVGEYCVYSGHDLIGLISLRDGQYHATGLDGIEVGSFKLLADAVAAMPERVG